MKENNKLVANPQPDGLEWMLQNSQISDGDLIAALADGYSESLYRSMLDHFRDPGRAHWGAVQVLALVVINRQRYWGDIRFEDWLNKWNEQVYQLEAKRGSRFQEAVQPHDQASIEPSILASEIGKAAVRLKQKRRSSLFIGMVSLVSLLLILAGALLVWITRPEADPAYLSPDKVWFYYQYTIKPGDTLESIARNANVKPQVIIALNPILEFISIKPDWDLELPALKPNPWKEQLSWANLLARFPPSPLSMNSSPETVRQRLLDNQKYWRTLKADYLFKSYGVPGYASPGSIYQNRILAWIRQPDLWRSSTFSSDSSIVFNEFKEGDHLFYKNDPGGPISGIFLAAGEVRDLYWFYLPILDKQANPGGAVKLLGSEKVAGRDALVIDWYNAQGGRSYRLWIDTVTGVVLARRQYGGNDYQTPIVDMVMNDVQFDQKIPEDIFNPALLVNEIEPSPKSDIPISSTLPVELEWAPAPEMPPAGHVTPPPNFDPAKSRLTIFWPQDNQVLPAAEDPGGAHQVHVFADRYYLGSLELPSGGAAFSDCRRSPDGTLVGVTTRDTDTGLSNTLVWFPLSNIKETHMAITETKYSSDYGAFDFSPDSRQLAFSACRSDWTDCSIYILDLPTDRLTKLYDLGNLPWSLAWRSDGAELAVFESPTGYSPVIEVLVFEVGSAKLLEKNGYDENKLGFTSNSQIQAWNLDVPLLLTSLEGCSAP